MCNSMKKKRSIGRLPGLDQRRTSLRVYSGDYRLDQVSNRQPLARYPFSLLSFSTLLLQNLSSSLSPLPLSLTCSSSLSRQYELVSISVTLDVYLLLPYRWSVILPVSWVEAFWISLVSKGAHAMGLREKRWISCEVGLPYFPSDFPDCDAYLCLKETEAAASNLKEELRPPAIRPLRVPILSPWNSIRVALNEESNAVGNAESFRQQHGIRSNSSSNSDSRNSDATLAACHGNSFDEYYSMLTRKVFLKRELSESFDGGLQLPQSAVASYFAEQSSGKWELQMPEDPVLKETYRSSIGFVTTGFVRGSKKPVAQAFWEAVVLACLREEQWDLVPAKRRRREIYVLVRNLRSSAYRLALATIVLEHQEEDVEFL
ncbi:ribonucleases P/MRP protein subunit POP1-like [Pyrus x bretschneideri]|uniref:ribonucleases P/MRP protein subunit POP1-like n=1 Tax=Pyrus x bretschneideri TaxID=225117 RepID=UPI00202E73A3|nr:ribonucleases P/MRP protein subunit POP1-like [Pyrus x bretschneideri]